MRQAALRPEKVLHDSEHIAILLTDTAADFGLAEIWPDGVQ